MFKSDLKVSKFPGQTVTCKLGRVLRLGMNLIVFFRNKAVADGAVSFYLDRCVAVRIATSTFGIECLTSFNEEDLEHIARSDKAIIRPSGRVVLPDYFDVILKKVSWCCASQPTSSRLTLSSHRAPACPRRLNFGDRIMWNPQFPSGRELRKSCAIVAAEKIQSGLISSHVRKKLVYMLVLTPLSQITIRPYAQSLQILPAYQSPRRLDIRQMGCNIIEKSLISFCYLE